MRKGRGPTWLVLMLAGAGLVLTIPGLWVFVSLTARPFYPNPESVPADLRAAPSPKWVAAVERGRRIVRASVAEQNLPGVSVAVGIDGEMAWAEGFGFADVRTSTPVTPNHRFRIGTASTALTSAAVGLLVENGRLKLDDEIQTYVPAFPKKQWPVTLRELMGHTAGVISGVAGGGSVPTEHCERPAKALPYFAEKPLLFEPGMQYLYSNSGWILVSTAIEAAAEQPFLTFLRERVFDPLGMGDTIADAPTTDEADEDFPPFIMIRELIHDPDATRDVNADPTKNPPENHVTSYFPRFRKDPTHGMHVARRVDYSCYAGASVFASTPSDLVRFGMAINGGKLLKPATVEMLQTPQRLSSGEETGYGLGWYVKTLTLGGKQTRAIGSDGNSMGGMVASLMTAPEYGIVVAVTSNVSFADTFSLAVKVAESFVEH